MVMANRLIRPKKSNFFLLVDGDIVEAEIRAHRRGIGRTECKTACIPGYVILQLGATDAYRSHNDMRDAIEFLGE